MSKERFDRVYKTMFYSVGNGKQIAKCLPTNIFYKNENEYTLINVKGKSRKEIRKIARELIA